jgi:transcriptional regulator with XRE-family HTH domain
MNERLKDIRHALSFKQSDFASELSISQGHLSDVENGRKEVSDRIISICTLKFNVNEKWLRYGEGNMFNPLSVDDELNALIKRFTSGNSKKDLLMKKLILALNELSDDEFDAVKRFISLMNEG